MNVTRDALPYLRLVDPQSMERAEDSGLPQYNDWKLEQISLFSDASSETLGFIEVDAMDASTFLNLLEDVRPKYIFDLRQTPTFSDGRLNRKVVFSLFEKLNIRYFDVAGALKTKSHRDAAFNPSLLAPNLRKLFLRTDKPISGPVLFFVNATQIGEDFIDGVATKLPHLNNRGWEVSVWQRAAANDLSLMERDIIFVSHANPQDNATAEWFATRLAAEGYCVWSDVTKLIGGELFWESIEDVIRHKAARVVVLLSKDGHQKPGVLDEVNIAISTERSLGIQNFVIPIRIDELKFSEIRANLARKVVIDGSSNLAKAFSELLKTLDAGNVPRSSLASTLTAWQHIREGKTTEAETDNAQWNNLIENSITIKSLPKSLCRYTGLSKQEFHKPEYDGPTIAFADGPKGLFSFADSIELTNALESTSTFSKSGEALTLGVLNENLSSVFGSDQKTLRRIIVSLISNAWNNFCRDKGLKEYRLANTGVCWFFPEGLIDRNKIEFVDHQNKRKTKALVGRSEKRNVYWHFGIEAKIAIATGAIQLKPHVVFSADGLTPLSSASRQHSLRRGFCRSWWNDRWRDLLSAALSYLSNGCDEWDIPVSEKNALKVSGKLRTYALEAPQAGDPRIQILSEPTVEVGFSQFYKNPREGLHLFGPVSFDRNPREIRVGVIGTADGIELFSRWCEVFNKPIKLSELQMQRDESPFDGFEAIFKSKWMFESAASLVVSRHDLINAIRSRDRHHAVYKTVSQFITPIEEALRDDDLQIDIWFVVIPDDVYLYGRPQSQVPTAISIAPASHINKRIARRFAGSEPSLFEQDNSEARIYSYHADFHHQLKARLLRTRAVTQIIRESSIIQSLEVKQWDEQNSEEILEEDDFLGSGKRKMQDATNVSWNIATASFFKAGGRPWKVSTARPGVCYIGLIFKRSELNGGTHACCGAQLFLDSGEGIVFKGAVGPWYSPDTNQFHLSFDEAKNLMKKVLATYKSIHNIQPSEVFIHGRTRFSNQELKGFREAVCDEATKVVGVRITRTNDTKLYTSNDLPVKRGTKMVLNKRVGLIWTSGYIEELNTYQGRETPNPLRVEICGDDNFDLDVVLQDIMTLTKMNFNSAVYGDGFPVTMRFADAIGDVLMATGDRELPPLPFRHYI